MERQKQYKNVNIT